MNESVLIIDDEPDSVETIGDVLELENISYRGEVDPEKAIENFKANPTDIVIVDYRLSRSGLTGLDVIQQLREFKPFTRFILISAWLPLEIDERNTSEQLINRVKVDRYIPKPYDIKELTNIVKDMLTSVEKTSEDWVEMSKEYVARGAVSADEVREINEQFKKAILDSFPEDNDE